MQNSSDMRFTKCCTSEFLIEAVFNTGGPVVAGRVQRGHFELADRVAFIDRSGQLQEYSICSVDVRGEGEADSAGPGAAAGLGLISLSGADDVDVKSKFVAGTKLVKYESGNPLLGEYPAEQQQYFEEAFLNASEFPETLSQMEALLKQPNITNECGDFLLSADIKALLKAYLAVKYHRLETEVQNRSTGASLACMNAVIYLLPRKEGGKGTPLFDGYRPSFQFLNRIYDTALPRGVILLNRVEDGQTPVMTSGMLPPGEARGVYIQLDAPETLKIGDAFNVFEGKELVAVGVVEEALNHVTRLSFA